MDRRDRFASWFVRQFGGLLVSYTHIALSPLLMVFSSSLRGGIFAMASLVTWVTTLATFYYLCFHFFEPQFCCVVIVVVGLIALMRVLIHKQLATPFSQYHATGWSSVQTSPYTNYHPESIREELDYLEVLFGIIFRVPLWAPRAKRRMMHDRLTEYIREMREDPQLLRLRSQWFDSNDNRLTYYIPHHEPGEKLPAILIYHGHGGNISIANWVWAKLAEEYGFVAVFPTYNVGEWEARGACEATRTALKHIQEWGIVDLDWLFLAGLSQGGCGVSRATAQHKGWKGLIYVSAVLEPEELIFLPKDVPIFAWQGEKDVNVRTDSVTSVVNELSESVYNVTYHVEAEADHFLFFEYPQKLVELLEPWWPRRSLKNLHNNKLNRQDAKTPGRKV
ncbi:MAG: alpha/beta hydrolase family protein [Fimbriiglobus sp.]